MSIHDLIANAEVADFLPISTEKEKRIVTQKGKVTAAILNTRYNLHMEQEEFARYIGISPHTLLAIEDGEFQFTMDMLHYLHEKLNRAFDIVVLPGDFPDSIEVSSSNLWSVVFVSQNVSYFQSEEIKIRNNFQEFSSGGVQYATIC